MTHDKNVVANDPDLFARELQHALFAEGPRSGSVRRLHRNARKAPGAELERIFETKLAEARRFKRESRRPNLMNVPIRAWEWLWENAQFVPTRDVVLTLIYVGAVVLGVEYVKGRLFPANDGAFAAPYHGSLELPVAFAAVGPHDDLSLDSQTTDAVDNWFSTEVAQALDRIIESEEFRQKLRKVVIEAIDGELSLARTRAVEPQDPVEPQHSAIETSKPDEHTLSDSIPATDLLEDGETK